MHLKIANCFKCIAVVGMGLLWQLPAPSLADREKRMGQSARGKAIGTSF